MESHWPATETPGAIARMAAALLRTNVGARRRRHGCAFGCMVLADGAFGSAQRESIWGPRAHHCVLAWNEKPGSSEGRRLHSRGMNDVWSSGDGAAWEMSGTLPDAV
jgi:hypothetical protein